jgi:ubiquinone/menaquinone biosynthesis C-methylase UbiE
LPELDNPRMKQNVSFISVNHNKTKRNYDRMPLAEKPHCAEVSKRFGYEYWDGDRKYGYGGYKYDGRWADFAKRLVDHYRLTDRSSILDIGCGKGFQLYEIKKLLPGARVQGIDVSEYAISNAVEGIKPFVKVADARNLPFADKEFDFVFSLNTLHNLFLFDLVPALRELVRVCKGDSYIVMDSYRNETEKANLLAWQLTCESFYTPQEWQWIYEQAGYTGDFEYIYFE